MFFRSDLTCVLGRFLAKKMLEPLALLGSRIALHGFEGLQSRACRNLCGSRKWQTHAQTLHKQNELFSIFWSGMPWMKGVSSPGKPYWLSLGMHFFRTPSVNLTWLDVDTKAVSWLSPIHLAGFQLDKLQKLLIIHHVNLQENPTLSPKPYVCASVCAHASFMFPSKCTTFERVLVSLMFPMSRVQLCSQCLLYRS